MADFDHVEILKRGPEAWNLWRAENPDVTPDFKEADLGRDLAFWGTDIHDADFQGAQLKWANFSMANLYGANFAGANLEAAVFYGADLRRADFSGADLRGSDLSSVAAIRANFTDCNLCDATLILADFSGADLFRTNLTKARLGATVFADVDLSTAEGLESVRHHGPSSVGIDVVYRSEGKIPEGFLRGAGVADSFIQYVRSLPGTVLDYYSCFVSYSSRDQEFVDRIYADLQANGVRCWLATEDLKIGDKFRQRIDEAIRSHDKLLVVLSEASVNSTWVEEEVESAFARERKENGLVLFPVRLDDAVITTYKAWAANLQRMRHIGNFSKWQNHNSYQKAFQRLLRDLQGKGPETTAVS